MEFSPLTTRPKLFRLLLCLLVVLLGFLTFQNTLGNFFSASDSLTLIQSSRLQSVSDLAPIFSEKMMNGTTFEGIFYRPISILSYQLDYLVWRLNPFGYHLTDLVLHIMVTVMTLLLGLRLTKGDWKISLVAACLFTSHPILVETVPAIARRQDVLETLFLILSFYTYLSTNRTGRFNFPLWSLFFFILALGSKETAVQIPGLVFFHALIYPTGPAGRLIARIKGAILTTAPFLMVTLLYLAWRIHVLGSLGADGANYSPHWILAQFFTNLLYPQDFLYLKDNLGWMAVPGFVLVAMTALGFMLAKSRVSGLGSPGWKLPVLFLIWLILPLMVLIATGNFTHRNLYSSIVPFSLLVGVIIGRGIGLLHLIKVKEELTWKQALTRKYAGTGLLVSTCLLTASLVAYSPLIQDYPQWRQSGLIAQRVLTLLTENLEQFPHNAVINISGLPQVEAAPSSSLIPRAHSVSYLRDYSVQSWLNLQDGDRGLQVVARDPQVLPVNPVEPGVQISQVSPEAVDIKILWNQP